MVQAAANWTIPWLIGRWSGPEALGAYAAATALLVPLFSLFNLQLRNLLATDARTEFECGNYYLLRLLTSGCGLVLSLMIAELGGVASTSRIVFLMLSLTTVMDALSDIVQGRMQQMRRNDLMACALIVRAVVSTVAFSAVYRWSNSLPLGLAAMVASRVALAGSLEWRLAHQGVGLLKSARTGCFNGTSRSAMARLARLAAPMGVVVFLSSITLNANRFVVLGTLGSHHLGLYAAAATLLGPFRTIFLGIADQTSVGLAVAFVEGRGSSFRRLFFKLAGVGFVLGLLSVVGCLLWGDKALTTLFSPRYARLGGLLVWLAVAEWISSTFMFGTALTACRVLKPQVPRTLAALIVSIISTALLVRANGIVGVGQAAALTALCNALTGFLLFRGVRSESGQFCTP
jgi:O-antigen/teichoic acid export membrane protein